MALQENPDFQPGLRIAAASNAMAARPEQAHRAVARLRQLNPALRVSTLKIVLGPYRRAEDLSRLEEGLRQAGLPEVVAGGDEDRITSANGTFRN